MYIRTKDGVYDTSKGLYTPSIKMWAIGTVTIYDEDILKQSENLEELCDEFVCEWFDKEVNRYRHVYCRFKIGQNKEWYRRDIPLPTNVVFEIYAGIWVDGKGLIYVAKIDNEGKLVLI